MACLRKEDLMAFPIKDLRNDELAQRLTDFKNTDPTTNVAYMGWRVMDAVLDCCYTRIDGYADFDGYVHDECGAVVRQVDREKHYDWCRRVKLRKPE
jgi:hypothetical protein